ncbi:MAG: HK97 gp10 family phage protein [Aerococcus sp.]|nr:HK97 gp10 family phage protein [Aerococcus sp.]
MGEGFEYGEFEVWVKNFNKMMKDKSFLTALCQSLGQGVLRDLKANTPVGQYDGQVFFTGRLKDGTPKIMTFSGKTHRVGGELRRGWHFVGVEPSGDSWLLTWANGKEYASFVENGHRKADHSGWVEGQFFARTTMEEVADKVPRMIEPKWEAWLHDLGFD